MYKLKINFFGESWKLTRLSLSNTAYNELLFKAKNLNTSLMDVLLDAISFNESNHDSVQGLINTYKNQIEIWYAGKKIKKLKLVDLNNEMLLFPLYHLITKQLKYASLPKGIYIEQEEIGLIACYEINLEKFNINDLSFELIRVEKQEERFEILKGINYKKLPIKLYENKIDTLITKQICFEV